MCKFGFNFFKIIFQFAPCIGQTKITPGQTGLNIKDKDITNLKLIHKHHCYL